MTYLNCGSCRYYVSEEGNSYCAIHDLYHHVKWGERACEDYKSKPKKK